MGFSLTGWLILSWFVEAGTSHFRPVELQRALPLGPALRLMLRHSLCAHDTCHLVAVILMVIRLRQTAGLSLSVLATRRLCAMVLTARGPPTAGFPFTYTLPTIVSSAPSART